MKRRRRNSTSACLPPIIVELVYLISLREPASFLPKNTDGCPLSRYNFSTKLAETFEPSGNHRERPLEATGCHPCDTITARLQPTRRSLRSSTRQRLFLACYSHPRFPVLIQARQSLYLRAPVWKVRRGCREKGQRRWFFVAAGSSPRLRCKIRGAFPIKGTNLPFSSPAFRFFLCACFVPRSDSTRYPQALSWSEPAMFPLPWCGGLYYSVRLWCFLSMAPRLDDHSQIDTWRKYVNKLRDRIPKSVCHRCKLIVRGISRLSSSLSLSALLCVNNNIYVTIWSLYILIINYLLQSAVVMADNKRWTRMNVEKRALNEWNGCYLSDRRYEELRSGRKMPATLITNRYKSKYRSSAPLPDENNVTSPWGFQRCTLQSYARCKIRNIPRRYDEP